MVAGAVEDLGAVFVLFVVLVDVVFAVVFVFVVVLVADAFFGAVVGAASAAAECFVEACSASVDVPLVAGGTVAATPPPAMAVAVGAETAFTGWAEPAGAAEVPQPARAAATTADRTREAPERLCTR